MVIMYVAHVSDPVIVNRHLTMVYLEFIFFSKMAVSTLFFFQVNFLLFPLLFIHFLSTLWIFYIHGSRFLFRIVILMTCQIVDTKKSFDHKDM